MFRAPADALAGQALTLTGTVTTYPRETSVGGRSSSPSGALDGGWNAPDAVIYGTDDWAALEPGEHRHLYRRSGKVHPHPG